MYRFRSGLNKILKRCRPLLALALIPGLGIGLARAASADSSTSGHLTILENQNYALCAGAVSFVFDKVLYAKCSIENGTSLSLPLNYPSVTPPGQPAGAPIASGGNIATVNQAGTSAQTFMVSTYSPPTQALKSTANGNLALYTCKAGSTGSYAQCDGGICFKNTSGTTFPGVGAVAANEIICSCPIATPGASSKIGWQVYGPKPCLDDKQYHNLCNASVHNGSTMYIGAPTGGTELFAATVTGQPVELNHCMPHGG